MALELPGFGSSTQNYISAQEVTFRPSDGHYRVYNAETKEKQELATISGFIVGIGFKYKKSIISKKGNVYYQSNEFGFDAMKDSNKKIAIYINEAGVRSKLDSKSFAAWKEENEQLPQKQKFTLVKCIYLRNDGVTYRVEFSGLGSYTISQLIKKDSPGFLATFGVSDEPKSNDFGESYIPTLTFGETPSAKLADELSKLISEYDSILNQKQLSLPSAPDAGVAAAEHVFG